MTFKKVILLILSLFISISFLNGCAATRKAKAAKILKSCSLEFQSATLDSVKLDPELFKKTAGTVLKSLPNPRIVALVKSVSQGVIPDSLGTLYFSMNFAVENAEEDTLWLRSIQGSVSVDSNITFPLELSSPVALVPGTTTISANSKAEIGPRILKLLTADSLKMNGELQTSLSPTGDLISFEVKKTEPITEEDKKAFKDYAKNAILDALINSWTSALK